MGIFFTPAWQSYKPYKALDAVDKINDQDKLVRIACEAYSEAAVIAAIGKIFDQDKLVYVARKTTNEDAIKAIIQKLSDQKLIAGLIKYFDFNDAMLNMHQKKYFQTRIEYSFLLLAKITDEIVLLDIIKNVKNLNIKIKAREHLTEICNHVWDGCVCSRCNKQRHNIIDNKCEICGDIPAHACQWINCKCKICGKERPHYFGLGDRCLNANCDAVTDEFKAKLEKQKNCTHDWIHFSDRITSVFPDDNYSIEFKRCRICEKRVQLN